MSLHRHHHGANSTDSLDETGSVSSVSSAVDSTGDITVSLSAAGWLQTYEFGVAQAIVENFSDCRIAGIGLEEMPQQQQHDDGDDDGDASGAPRPRRITFAGSSAGSLASAAILLGVNMGDMLEYACDKVRYCRQHWTHAFQIRSFVSEGVDRFAVQIFFSAAKDLPGSPQATAAAAAAAAKSGSGSAFDAAAPPSAAEEEAAAPLTEQQLVRAMERLGPKGGWATPSEYVFPQHIRQQLNERIQIFATAIPWPRAVVFGRAADDGTKTYEIRCTSDLEEALAASTNLVPLAGMPFRLRRGDHDLVVDGGLLNFQPHKSAAHHRPRRPTSTSSNDGTAPQLQQRIITVSPMYFQASDVSPSVWIPAWYGLYPPCEDTYRALYAVGYNDMTRYLWRQKLAEKIPDDPAEAERALEAKLMPVNKAHLPSLRFDNFVLDFFAFFFFVGLRPIAYLAVYIELLFVGVVALCAFALHEVFPSSLGFLIGTQSKVNLRKKDATRLDAFRDLWAIVLNLASPKTWLHLVLGFRRNVKFKRLATYSRMYRVFQPFITEEPDKSQ